MSVENLIHDRRSARWMELVAAFIAIALTMVVCVQAILPYYGFTPTGVDSLIAQHDALIGNMFIAVVAFFFGSSVGSRRQGEISSANAGTAAIGLPKSTSAETAVSSTTDPDV